MKSQVRSHVAAVLLLAPVAATMVAAPAYAQRAVVAPAAVIQQFEARPSGRLEAGGELRFRLVGAPNGRAWVDVPGVARRVALDETRPGVYEGAYTVRRRDSLDSFSEAIATLQTGNVRATARADLRSVDREYGRGYGWGQDNRGPEITNVSPADNSRVVERERTTISARLSDDGRGVDPGSVTLRVDGRDVTRNARITDNEINYRDDLGRGRHTAELTVRDRAGNTARRNWSFEVVEPRENHANVPPPAVTTPYPQTPPLVVTSHADQMVVDLIRNGITLRGRTAPNAEVVVSIEARSTTLAPLEVPDQRARADANGFFSVYIPPVSSPWPLATYDLHLMSVTGPAAITRQKIVLRQVG